MKTESVTVDAIQTNKHKELSFILMMNLYRNPSPNIPLQLIFLNQILFLVTDRLFLNEFAIQES